MTGNRKALTLNKIIETFLLLRQAQIFNVHDVSRVQNISKQSIYRIIKAVNSDSRHGVVIRPFYRTGKKMFYLFDFLKHENLVSEKCHGAENFLSEQVAIRAKRIFIQNGVDSKTAAVMHENMMQLHEQGYVFKYSGRTGKKNKNNS